MPISKIHMRTKSKIFINLDKLKRGQIIKKMRNLSSIMETKIDLSQYTYENCIKIIQVHHPYSADEIKVISHFLRRSDLCDHLKKDHQLDQLSFDKLITTLTTFLFMKEFEENQKIISIDEEADKFYILLSGKIEILSPRKKYARMTGYEYFSHLVQIKTEIKNGNDEIKKRYQLIQDLTLKDNNFTFPITKENFVSLQLLAFYIYYRRYSPSNQQDDEYFQLKHIELSLSKCFLTLNDLGIKYSLELPNLNVINQELNILFRSFSTDEEYKMSFLIDNLSLKIVVIYEFESEIKRVEPNENGIFIGKTNEAKYTETVFAKAKSVFLALPYEVYYQYLMNEKNNLLKKEIALLADSTLFKGIENINYFKKIIFPKIELCEYNKGDIILSDKNEIVDNVFYIKEGGVQINIKEKINIYELLGYLEQKVTQKFNKKLLLSQCIISPNNSIEEKNRNGMMKILDLGKNEFFGAGLIYFKMQNYFTLEISSSTAQIYKIRKELFIQLLNEEKEFHLNVKKISEQKIKLIISILKNTIHVSSKRLNDLILCPIATPLKNVQFKTHRYQKYPNSDIISTSSSTTKLHSRTKKTFLTIFNPKKLILQPKQTKKTNSFNTITNDNNNQTRNYSRLYSKSKSNTLSYQSAIKPIKSNLIDSGGCSYENNLLRQLKKMSLTQKHLSLKISDFSKNIKSQNQVSISFLTQLSNIREEEKNEKTPIKISSFTNLSTKHSSLMNEKLLKFSHKYNSKKSVVNSNNISVFVSTDTDSKNDDYIIDLVDKKTRTERNYHFGLIRNRRKYLNKNYIL